MTPHVATPAARPARLLLGLLLPALGGTEVPGSAAEPVIESFIAQATPEHPRHSEGDVLVLRDGTLLAAWTEFAGGARDDAPARIVAARSAHRDPGEHRPGERDVGEPAPFPFR